jgi:type VII secretion integral membrane protein EccD
VSGFTRLTLVGSSRRGDVAVPDDEPLDVLLPRLLDLLDEPAGAVTRPLALVRLDGNSLDLSSTVQDQDVRHGDVIRLIRSGEAPPPPEVAQVTDVLGLTSGGRRDRWTDESRARAGIVALGLLAAVAVLLAAGPLAAALPAATAKVVPIVATAAACVVAVACGLGRWRWGVAAATAVALGTGVPGAAMAAFPDRPSVVAWVLPLVTAVSLVVWVCLGTCVGLVLGRRAVVAGAVVGVLALLVPVVSAPLGPTPAAAVGAVVAVLALGLLPRFALGVAGLPLLEDHALQGDLSPWRDVQDAVLAAYAALTWSVVAVAVALAATVGRLAASTDSWATGLAAVLLLVTALRARTFPLVPQHAALWAAVAAALGQGLAARSGGLSLGSVAPAVAPLAVLLIALAVARPPDHVRATLRRLGDVSEVMAVVALAPLLVGVLGVYGDLLERFR